MRNVLMILLVAWGCAASVPTAGGEEPLGPAAPEAVPGVARVRSDAAPLALDPGVPATSGPPPSNGGGDGRSVDASETDSTGSPVDNPGDPGTTDLGGGKVVKAGWNQKDMLTKANWDGAMTGCPDPDAMVVPGTVVYKDGVWTMTGSGEGFMHGWDQGNLVYFEKRLRGDFDFTAQITELAPAGAYKLNGAAEAVLNVRDGLDYKAPSNSIIAGRMTGRTIFMGRFHWRNEYPPNGAGSRPIENKYWYWPAWPEAWSKEPPMEWVRLSRRGIEFRAYVSKTGAEADWQEVKNADTRATWYPYRLKTFGQEAIVGLVCTARNDRNLAPRKSDGCRDESSALLKQSARCVFKNVTIVQK